MQVCKGRAISKGTFKIRSHIQKQTKLPTQVSQLSIQSLRDSGLVHFFVDGILSEITPPLKENLRTKVFFLSTHTDMKHLRKNDFESWNFVRCNSSPDSLGSMSYFLLNVRVEYNFWPWIWSLSKSLYKNTDKVREINNN